MGGNRPGNDRAVETTPRLVKNFRSFSSARFTRILAASSLVPNAAPTSAQFWFSKYRSTMALWSFRRAAPLPRRAAERFASRFHRSRGSCLDGLHVRLLFTVLTSALGFQRVGGGVSRRVEQPAGQNGFGPSDFALRARMMKTAWAISWPEGDRAPAAGPRNRPG